MKLINAFLLCMLFGFTLTACSDDEPNPGPEQPDTEQPDTGQLPQNNSEVTIVDGVASDGATFRRLDENLFQIGDLKYEIKEDQMALVGYADGVTLIDVKPYAHVTYQGVKYDVTSIDSYAFSRCTTLKSFDMPATVTSIGAGVFLQCTSWTEMPDITALKEMGDGCFHGCTSLTSVVWPSNLTTVPSAAFYDCTSLSSVSLPTCTQIYRESFRGCTALKSISLPVCRYVGDYAFADCTALTEISAPECTEARGFQNCAMEELYLPKCKRINIEGCANNANLKKVVLPVCEYVGYGFRNCPNIETLDVPALKAIESGAFSANKVTELSLPACETVSVWPFELVKEISLPACKTVNRNGFTGSNLRTISLPACEVIEDKTFNDCAALTELRIGNACYKIGTALFTGSEALANIYCEAQQPPVTASGAFAGLPAGCVLHVRAAALANYKADPVWAAAFASIVGDL